MKLLYLTLQCNFYVESAVIFKKEEYPKDKFLVWD